MVSGLARPQHFLTFQKERIERIWFPVQPSSFTGELLNFRGEKKMESKLIPFNISGIREANPATSPGRTVPWQGICGALDSRRKQMPWRRQGGYGRQILVLFLISQLAFFWSDWIGGFQNIVFPSAWLV